MLQWTYFVIGFMALTNSDLSQSQYLGTEEIEYYCK